MSDTELLLRGRKERRNLIEDNSFRFDKTINLGSIIIVITFLIAMSQMYQGIVTRIDRIEVKVETMWTYYNSERLK